MKYCFQLQLDLLQCPWEISLQYKYVSVVYTVTLESTCRDTGCCAMSITHTHTLTQLQSVLFSQLLVKG